MAPESSGTSQHFDVKLEIIFLKFNVRCRALFLDISFLALRASRSVTDLLRTSLLAELSAIVHTVAPV